MKCPYCGKEALAAIHAFGGILFACPCVPPNTAVQVRVDNLILDAVRGDVLAFMRTEHDAGDEDLRGERFDPEDAVKRVPVPAAVIPILAFAWSAFALSFPFPIGDAVEMHTAHGVFLYVNDSANHDPGDENPRDYSVT